MKVEDLYRSENIRVKKVGGFSQDTLIVSFDSYTDKFSLDRPGFGENFFIKNNIDCIHIIPKNNSWYQYEEMSHIMEKICGVIQEYDQIFTYGASMGGYAAIRYGRTLNATAIAIAPQYSVDPKVMPEERRWHEAVSLTYSQECRKPIEPLKGTIIFYDPFNTFDRQHVKRITQDTSVIEAAIPYSGHMAGVYLAEVGMLAKGILEILNGSFDAGSFSRLARKRRRESAKYYEVLSNLARCRHPKWALFFAQQAVEICSSDAGPAHNLAEYHKERSEYEEAEFWEHKAIQLDPSNLLYQKFLAIIFLEKKESIRCRAILEKLIEAVPEEADYFHLMALSFRIEGKFSEAIFFEEKAVTLNPNRNLYKKDLIYLRKELKEQKKNSIIMQDSNTPESRSLNYKFNIFKSFLFKWIN